MMSNLFLLIIHANAKSLMIALHNRGGELMVIVDKAANRVKVLGNAVIVTQGELQF